MFLDTKATFRISLYLSLHIFHLSSKSVQRTWVPPTVHRLFPTNYIQIITQMSGNTSIVRITRIIADGMISDSEGNIHRFEDWF
jgi:hypothetical protein